MQYMPKVSRWLRRSTLALVAMSLAACASAPSRPAATNGSTSGSTFKTHTKFDRATVVLDFHPGAAVVSSAELVPMMQQLGTRGQTTSTYVLTDTVLQREAGRAESAFTTAQVTPSGLRGEVRITNTPGGGRILIQETAADTPKARRYILLQRKPDGTYDTWYLAPNPVTSPTGDSLPWLTLDDPGFDSTLRFKVPFTRALEN